MTQAEFNASLAARFPTHVLDGQCWSAITSSGEVHVIPIIGAELWHYGYLSYRDAKVKCSEEGMPLIKLARAIHSSSYSDIKPSQWKVDDEYKPVALNDRNPFSIRPPSIPKWVIPIRRRKTAIGQVYFLFSRQELMVKIGWTTRPRLRFPSIQTGCPSKLQLAATIQNQTMDDEKLLHARFKKYHYRGEWYRYEGELAEYVHKLYKERKACQSKSTM